VLVKTLRKVRFALLLLRLGGLRAFLRQTGRQLYSRRVLLGLEKDLTVEGMKVSSRLEYVLRPATKEDLEELLSKAPGEGRESVHELVERKWFYDSGFRNCYVARTAEGGELCHVQWLVSARADGEAMRNFRARLPSLRNDEVLVENVYTFERFRGNGLMSAVMSDLAALAKSQGFKRMIAYVGLDNQASLRGCDKAGFKKFEEVPELKLLFSTRRRHG
jgi:GNAT superfamily N-acetyltransferase